MASTRERARTAMATLDRLNPDIDHVGLNWSCWIDKFDILTDEDVFPVHSGGSKVEDSVDSSRRSDTMTLSKEDMKIYGYCPALDHFSLVVCSHCGHLVKPQAFEAHCDRRHSAVTKLCCPPPGRADQQCPRPGRLPSIPSSSRERHRVGESQEAGGFSKAASAPQHRTAKVQTEETRSPSVKTSGPQEAPPSSPCPSPSHPRAPPRAHAPLAPGTPVSSSSSSHSSSSSSSSSSAPASERQKPTAGPSGPRTYSRTHKKVYKKDGDLDERRGVLEPARKTLCTRQLVCNIHSVPRRRGPPGRSAPPDRLATEQRAGSSGSDADKLSAGEEGLTAAPAPYRPQAAQDPAAPKRGKRGKLGAGRPMLWTREAALRGPEEEADCAVEVEIQPPYPFNQSLPSSGGSEEEDEEEEEEEEGGGKEEEDAQEEEEEEEEEEENGDIPATPWHPKPLGICTFGSHTLGCSVFTFDRRLHHLRFALSDMVEQHVNAHLWKRIPQVPAVLQPCRPAATPQGSALKPRAPPGSGSPSSGPPGPRRHRPDLPGSGPPSAAEPHPARVPAGRPGRAPPRGREPAPVAPARPTQSAGRAEASALPVRTFPPRERKDQRRRHPPAPPLRPPAAAPRGPPDGHRAPAGATPSDRGSPSPPSSLRRGTGPGGRQQQGAGGPDFRGPAHKRKMSSSDWLASGHRAQPRSSSQSHRSAGLSPGVGLFSWRKGSGLGASPGD